jgi:hypothetical protein|tara:strand:+ start:1332 stop:2018 length:687 start_codon:yes stop_codon:yes gene_type:complete
MQIKAVVKWLLIISALMSVFSIFGLIITPTTSASQAEIDDCRSGERTPEEMGYSGLTCNDMEDGVMEPSLINYVRVLGCMTCVPSALILGVIFPFIKTPDPDGKIALKMQQLDDVNQQLNAARTLLKNFEKSLFDRQSIIYQTESRIRELEQTGQSVATGYQAELASLRASLAEDRMAEQKVKMEIEKAQQAMQVLKNLGIEGTVNNNVTYNINDSVVMGNVGETNKK